MKKIIGALALIGLFVATPLVAEGAGGIMYGYQNPEWAPNFIPRLGDMAPHYYYGGFGYGVDRRGVVTGGFGVCYMSQDFMADEDAFNDSTEILGGFGGAIYGLKLLDLGPFKAYLLSLTGIGGYAGGAAGWGVSLLEELQLEAGFTPLPWMQISAYLGAQAIGNLMPGEPFKEYLGVQPTGGVKISWGSF
jgi:hypothetical protein